MTNGWTFGIDVAYPQQNLDWDKVKANDVKFAYIKASESLFRDSYFFRNWQECQRVGIRRGAYHFAKVTGDPIKQAMFHADVVGMLSDTDMPSLLDFEEDFYSEKSKLKHVTSRERLQWIDAFCQELDRHTRKRTAIYTGAFILGDDKSIDLSGRGLFLAQYTKQVYWLPKQWKDWTFWQYSGDHGEKLKGISVAVDRDWFKGTEEQLDDWIASSNLGGDRKYPLASVLGVQRALSQLGFDPGKIDDAWGPATRGALKDFLTERNVAVVPTLTSFQELVTDQTRAELTEAMNEATDQSSCLPLEYQEVLEEVNSILANFGYEMSEKTMCAGLVSDEDLCSMEPDTIPGV